MDSGVSYTVYNDLYDYVDIQLSYPGTVAVSGFLLYRKEMVKFKFKSIKSDNDFALLIA